MSPITAAARERLMQYLQVHQRPHEPDPPTSGMIERLIADLVAAVRSELPSDRPF